MITLDHTSNLLLILGTPAQVITVGFAEAGCIGTGTIAEQAFPWPQVVSTLDHCEIVDLKTGLDHTVALNSRGEVWAWGMNASGQLGVGPTEDPCIALPMKAEGLPALTSIFAGADHSGGVDGTLAHSQMRPTFDSLLSPSYLMLTLCFRS